MQDGPTSPRRVVAAAIGGEDRGDSGLVRRAQAGDERAFEGLVERYGQPILSLCFASTLDRGFAEDVAQDVFVAAWRGLGRFRGESAFSTWLFAIARNACVDCARRRAARPPSTPLGDHVDLEAPAVDAMGVSEVLAIAAELSPALHQALLLREIQGLSYEEIAVVQDVPVGTVRSRLAAARGFCADRLRG